MKEDIKLIDVVIELIDARIPYSSKNPDIDKLAENKKRVILLNKSDMADDKLTKQWKEHYEGKGYAVAIINSKTGNGIKAINELVLKVCAEKIAKEAARLGYEKIIMPKRNQEFSEVWVDNVSESEFGGYLDKKVAE